MLFRSLLITLPCDILIVMALFGLVQLFIGWLGILALFFIALFVVLLLSIRSTIFALWKPAILLENMKAVPAFKKSLSVVFKNFWLLFSYYIVTYLGLILMNLIVACFTCFAGLLISLPTSMVIVAIFQMIFYFSYKRKKYYTDGDTIIEARLDHTMPDLEPLEEMENGGIDIDIE